MSLLFAITTLIIAGVNLYCYLFRNTSIADISTFWISAFAVMLGVSIAFIMDYLNADPLYYIIIYIPTTVVGFLLCRTSIRNIKGDWNDLQNAEEVKTEVAAVKKQTVSYVRQALEELPNQNFSKDFQKTLFEKLNKDDV